MGLMLICCGCHHPSRALTCSLILGSSLLALTVGLTCAHPGLRSLAVVLGLTLTCLLLCWCTYMAHIEVFTPFGRGSSSSSRHLLPQWDRTRKVGKGKEGCFSAASFSQASSVGVASSPHPCGVPQVGTGLSKVQHWAGPCSAQFWEQLQPQS